MSIVIAVIIASTLLPLGARAFNRAANRAVAAAIGTPLSEEVVRHAMRELEHAAAGLEVPALADGIEELWEASP